VFLDFPFGLPLADTGIAFRTPDGAVDEVLDAHLFGGLGKIIALDHFAPRLRATRLQSRARLRRAAHF
jgi:hypothetical protein